MKKGKLFVVSAPSGAGKTTLVNEVLKTFKEHNIQRVVTFTSKKPSLCEVSGVDYHFVSEEDFKAKIEQGFFVEYSTVYGAYYGFPKSALYLIEEGLSFIAIVDRAGAVSLKAYKEDAILVAIRPPDKKALAERLSLRARDTTQEIEFRLGLADEEFFNEEDDKLYTYVIVNDQFEKALAIFRQLIVRELAEIELS
ncbi:guanylate kinase [Candidatus Dependentiae bacterium]|nr:guanylate kinase [Candidatus Dependentiae bacterium]